MSFVLRRHVVAATLSLATMTFGPREALSAGPTQTPTQTDDVAAESLFASGKALMKERRWSEACAKFDASRKLSPGIGITLWLADCEEKAERTASAWLHFREGASLARQQGDSRVSLAEDRAKKLEAKLSRVRVVLDGFRGQVLRDGVELPAGALDTATPVDPGRYTFRFVERGRPTREAIVEVSSDARLVDVRVSDARDVEDAPASSAASAPAPASVPVRAEAEARPSRTAGYVLLGISAVGLGVGTAFGVSAANAKSQSNDGHCTGNTCDAEGVSLRDDAFGRATVSTIAFGVGLVALGAGVLVFTGVFDKSPAKSAVSASLGGLRW